MNNGANYKWGKIYHSPCHSDIRTPNQLNTPPVRLWCPFQTKNTKQKRRGANQPKWISLNQTCPINLLPDGSADAFSSSNTIRASISKRTEATLNAILNSNPKANSESNPDNAHRSTLLQAGRFWQWLCEGVNEHLSSRYIAQVNLSICSHVCSKIVLGRNVCNFSSVVDSVPDAHDEWLWIREHMRDSRDAELVQERRDLCETHAAYSKGLVVGIRHGLGSRLLFSRSPVNRSSESDYQTTWPFIVIRASSIVRIEITSMCTVSFSSECSPKRCSECSSRCSSRCSSKMQLPVLHAIKVLKHALGSYHMLIAQVVMVPAENSDGICNIGPSGSHRIHEASDHRLVYGWITGFFIGLPLVKLHRHWRGNWSGFIHSELRQDCPNIAVLMNVDRVMLPIAFDVHAEIDGDTLEITHLEPLLLLARDLPNQALVSHDVEMINVQNDCGNDYVLILIVEHEQSSVHTWCHETNWDHEILGCAVPNARWLF